MKKITLITTLLAASTLVLGGCGNEEQTSTSGSEASTQTTTSVPTTSVPTSTSQPTPQSDWPDDVKEIMKDVLNDVVLPYCEGTWEWTPYDGALYGEANDTTIEVVNAIFTNDLSWKNKGPDEEGDQQYWYDVNGLGYVKATVYDGTQYEMGKAVIMAYYQSSGARTTDTEWNDKVKTDLMNTIGEEIPFFQFGENYTSAAAADFYAVIYDNYDRDLTNEYCTLLKEESKYVYSGKSEGGEVFYKLTSDLSQILMVVSYDDTLGNMITIMYSPNKKSAQTWADITPIAEFEEYAGYTIPTFEADSYLFFVHCNTLHIQGRTTTDLTAAYEALLMANPRFDLTTNLATDWEEKVNIEYEVIEGEDDTSIEGFYIKVRKVAETGHTLSDEWPEADINAWIKKIFSEEGIDIPKLENTTDRKVKSLVYTYDEQYNKTYEALWTYNNYIYEYTGEYVYTETQIVEMSNTYAIESAGFYIYMHDVDSTLVEAYRALFNDDWEEIVKEDSGSHYYYEIHKDTGITLCIYEYGGNFILQICTFEQEFPEPPVIIDGNVLTANFSLFEFENGEELTEIILDEATNTKISLAKGGSNMNPKWYDSGVAIRAYAQNTVTITSDRDISEIKWAFGTGDQTNAIIADCGTYADGTWTGSSKSVTFTIDGTSGHRKLAGVQITFAESE